MMHVGLSYFAFIISEYLISQCASFYCTNYFICYLSNLCITYILCALDPLPVSFIVFSSLGNSLFRNINAFLMNQLTSSLHVIKENLLIKRSDCFDVYFRLV